MSDGFKAIISIPEVPDGTWNAYYLPTLTASSNLEVPTNEALAGSQVRSSVLFFFINSCSTYGTGEKQTEHVPVSQIFSS